MAIFGRKNQEIMYANPEVCATRDFTCFFEPLTSCRNSSETLNVVKQTLRFPCAVFDPNVLRVRAGLKHSHSRLFYEAGAAAYLLRPNSRLRAAYATLRTEMNIREQQTLSVYVRHGDSEADGRPYVRLGHYADLAKMVAYWHLPDDVDTLFFGSDDGRVKQAFSNSEARELPTRGKRQPITATTR